MTHPLSPRELDVLRVMATGVTGTEAAAQLGVSPQTFKNHLATIYHKLNVRGLVAAYAKLGWLVPGPASKSGELDVAWAEAVAALPPDCSLSLHKLAFDEACEAVAGEHGPHPVIVKQAETPAEALRALVRDVPVIR